MNTWLEISEESDFPLSNLPFGVFSDASKIKRVGVAIGSYVIDLHRLQQVGLLNHKALPLGVFDNSYLNSFISCEKEAWMFVRTALTNYLLDESSLLKAKQVELMTPMDQVTMHLPVQIGDYTDFYASEEHATNVGSMFRDPEKALLPNWKHMPVAYHGRASSILPTETAIHRPKGQVLLKGAEKPVFKATEALDFEIEMGCVIGKGNQLGNAISIEKAMDHVFGLVIFNDWSARDIQRWEYVPLGPFLGKNFASSISPWVVTMEALDLVKTKSPQQSTEVLPYLKRTGDKHSYDIKLECWLITKEGVETKISTTNHQYLYWTIDQQIAHHTVNGCNLNIGDLLASGTISGSSSSSYGSLLELTWNGTKSIQLNDKSERRFVEDYDTVMLKAYAIKGGVRIGFGSVKNCILPVKE